MHEYYKIALTAGFTLIGGITLLILNKVFVESIQDLRRTIGEAAAVVFMSHSLLADELNPDVEELKAVTIRLRELSARLRGSLNVVPCPSLFAFLHLIPNKQDILKASGCLSVLSYSQYQRDKSKVSETIETFYTLLHLDMYEVVNEIRQ
jgi:hypothetical protein